MYSHQFNHLREAQACQTRLDCEPRLRIVASDLWSAGSGNTVQRQGLRFVAQGVLAVYLLKQHAALCRPHDVEEQSDQVTCRTCGQTLERRDPLTETEMTDRTWELAVGAWRLHHPDQILTPLEQPA